MHEKKWEATREKERRSCGDRFKRDLKREKKPRTTGLQKEGLVPCLAPGNDHTKPWRKRGNCIQNHNWPRGCILLFQGKDFLLWARKRQKGKKSVNTAGKGGAFGQGKVEDSFREGETMLICLEETVRRKKKRGSAGMGKEKSRRRKEDFQPKIWNTEGGG